MTALSRLRCQGRAAFGVRLRHRPVVERLVERLLVDAGFAGDLPQRPAGRGGFLDDLGRLVVADVRVERCRGRERELGVVLAGLSVRLDPVDALLGEEASGRGEEADRVEELRAITGTKTFSSKWPCMPPTVIAASFPITCAATWVTTSGMTGLTLPGMIELPFWSSGSAISARPARGPDPISRMSFAILVSETATTFIAAEASTSPSRAAWASNGSAAARMVRPVSSLSRRGRARRTRGAC